MPIQFFSIRAFGDDSAQQALNAFLNQHRVSSIQKELISNGDNSFWAIAVEYLNGESKREQPSSSKKSQVDYRELLNPEDFAIYSRLRETRKLIAEREGVPVYTIFTNQQLADIVTHKIKCQTQMSKIRGVGKSRVNKYASEFLTEIQNLESTLEGTSETSEPSVSQDY